MKPRVIDRRAFVMVALGAGLAALTGCSAEQTDAEYPNEQGEQGVAPATKNQPFVSEGSSSGPEDRTSFSETVERPDLGTLVLMIGSQRFEVMLEDSAAAQELVARLPLALSMEELNGNEKFAYLDRDLPQSSSVLDSIEAGDLMLYGSNCLVLFYEGHESSYRYTRLGRVDSGDRLAQVLGSGSVDVSFEVR